MPEKQDRAGHSVAFMQLPLSAIMREIGKSGHFCLGRAQSGENSWRRCWSCVGGTVGFCHANKAAGKPGGRVAATLWEMQGGQPRWNTKARENFGPNSPRNRVERCKGARCCVWPRRWGVVLQGGLHLRKDTWSKLSTENSRSFWPIVPETFGLNILRVPLF